MRLRVMSYNVHACVGVDRRLAPERIAQVIADAAPDVVALQEVDHGRRRTGYVNQSHEIATVLEMQHHFHPSVELDDGLYGNAILSRWPLEVMRAAPLARPWPVLRLEPRAALWVQLHLPAGPVNFMNTHLGLLPGERLQQVRDLLGPEFLAHPSCEGPTILCGDFNAGPGSPTHQALCRRLADCEGHLARGRRQNTFVSYLPMTRIDHVFVCDRVRVREVQVPRTGLTRLASDHLPLVVDLEILPGPGSMAPEP